jgi:hypothetical protein
MKAVCIHTVKVRRQIMPGARRQDIINGVCNVAECITRECAEQIAGRTPKVIGTQAEFEHVTRRLERLLKENGDEQ